MKLLLLLVGLVLFLSGCATAASIPIHWTYPRWEAGNLCVAGPDTLKDLGRVELYRKPAGASDSSLVLSKICLGQEGQEDSLQVNQPEGTFVYWLYAYDILGNSSCVSNFVSKTVTTVPSPPSVR